jgi:L-lactate dehydrogenase complex protein LldG
MDESTSREKILKKIRNANIYKTENPFQNIDNASPIYQEITESLDVAFAQEFTRIAGKFVFCENLTEFAANLKAVMHENGLDSLFCLEPRLCSLLESAKIPFHSEEDKFLQAKAGLTECEYLIARLGSVMISSKQSSGRRLVVYPEYHFVMAYSHQLVPDLQEALAGIREKYQPGFPSLISVISGPSRTADIEKTLVMGAHGPKELYVFLVDEDNS